MSPESEPRYRRYVTVHFTVDARDETEFRSMVDYLSFMGGEIARDETAGSTVGTKVTYLKSDVDSSPVRP